MRLCYHMFVLIHVCWQPGGSINKGIVPDKQQCRFALLHLQKLATREGGGGGESYLGPSPLPINRPGHDQCVIPKPGPSVFLTRHVCVDQFGDASHHVGVNK